MDGEPALWFDRFDRYRLLGPGRTVEAIWAEEKKGDARRSGQVIPGSWYDAAKRWRWKARAEAWDASQRPDRQKQRLAALEDAQARHLQIARLQQAKALQALQALVPGELTPGEALKLMEVGIALERQSLEEPAIVSLQREVDEMKAEQEGTA